jgi:hypothetical protein
MTVLLVSSYRHQMCEFSGIFQILIKHFIVFLQGRPDVVYPGLELLTKFEIIAFSKNKLKSLLDMTYFVLIKLNVLFFYFSSILAYFPCSEK